MPWFQRRKENINTRSEDRKEMPNGMWLLCPSCKQTLRSKEHSLNLYVCSHCDYHSRIRSEDYFHILFDQQQYQKLFEGLSSIDSLQFVDRIPYAKRLQKATQKSGLEDAMQVATGKLTERSIVIAAMDFQFIGGSMGAVVGEKIARSVDYCIEHHLPLLIISKSGGARMMESAYALMQMGKTVAKLSQLAQAKLPFISLLTDPTSGGVSASFAMLGDINIAEPKALIAFAGPRVIKETIKKELPDGFQSAEFLLEHGFLDLIVHRKDLKAKLGELIGYLQD